MAGFFGGLSDLFSGFGGNFANFFNRVNPFGDKAPFIASPLQDPTARGLLNLQSVRPSQEVPGVGPNPPLMGLLGQESLAGSLAEAGAGQTAQQTNMQQKIEKMLAIAKAAGGGEEKPQQNVVVSPAAPIQGKAVETSRPAQKEKRAPRKGLRGLL